MLRFIFVGLLAVATAEAMIVKRQATAALLSECAFPLLPVLNVCPPCQPASCFCANGKELTSEDQARAEAVSTFVLVLISIRIFQNLNRPGSSQNILQ